MGGKGNDSPAQDTYVPFQARQNYQDPNKEAVARAATFTYLPVGEGAPADEQQAVLQATSQAVPQAEAQPKLLADALAGQQPMTVEQQKAAAAGNLGALGDQLVAAMQNSGSQYMGGSV
jgi:hypothetical protein